MKKNLTAFILLAIFMVPTIANALAWVQGDYSPGWVTRNHDSWESADDGESRYFEFYNSSIINFARWSYGIRLIDSTIRGWWGISYLEQDTYMTISDIAETHIITVKTQSITRIWLFGIITYQTGVFLYFDGEEIFAFGDENRLRQIDVNFFKKTSNEIGVSLVIRDDELNPIDKRETSFIVGDSWFDEVELTQRIEKLLVLGAEGYIKGAKVNEIISTGTEPIEDPAEGIELLSLYDQFLNSILGLVGSIQDIITGESPIQYISVTIQSNAGGTTNPSPDVYRVEKNTRFSAKAVPNGGYEFAYWLINGTSTSINNPLSILVNGDTTIKPYFSSLPPEPEKPTLPSYMPTLLACLTPGLVIGALGGSFWKLGDKMGEHGTAGFLAGGGMGLILCTYMGIIPMWITTILFASATICGYFWFRSE